MDGLNDVNTMTEPDFDVVFQRELQLYYYESDQRTKSALNASLHPEAAQRESMERPSMEFADRGDSIARFHNFQPKTQLERLMLEQTLCIKELSKEGVTKNTTDRIHKHFKSLTPDVLSSAFTEFQTQSQFQSGKEYALSKTGNSTSYSSDAVDAPTLGRNPLSGEIRKQFMKLLSGGFFSGEEGGSDRSVPLHTVLSLAACTIAEKGLHEMAAYQLMRQALRGKALNVLNSCEVSSSSFKSFWVLLQNLSHRNESPEAAVQKLMKLTSTPPEDLAGCVSEIIDLHAKLTKNKSRSQRRQLLQQNARESLTTLLQRFYAWSISTINQSELAIRRSWVWERQNLRKLKKDPLDCSVNYDYLNSYCNLILEVCQGVTASPNYTQPNQAAKTNGNFPTSAPFRPQNFNRPPARVMEVTKTEDTSSTQAEVGDDPSQMEEPFQGYDEGYIDQVNAMYRSFGPYGAFPSGAQRYHHPQPYANPGHMPMAGNYSMNYPMAMSPMACWPFAPFPQMWQMPFGQPQAHGSQNQTPAQVSPMMARPQLEGPKSGNRSKCLACQRPGHDHTKCFRYPDGALAQTSCEYCEGRHAGSCLKDFSFEEIYKQRGEPLPAPLQGRRPNPQ